MDRISGFGPEGWGFESLRSHQRIQNNNLHPKDNNSLSALSDNGTKSFLLNQEKINNTLSIALNPNPSSDGKFNLYISDLSKISEIIITNTLGETVFHSPIINTVNYLDLSDKPKGIYFVKILGLENIIVKKIIY